ncbi:hypothetical protein CDL15_Pgr009724 [Punica granatum]|uniref:F-box domain-containing protein n=1 Tax=Punica granatum TaxID=22663 RepID=A0A218WU76_PUNGR|nr:hypothetical protein CDL15_Pgr009724 [Punica granatum]
MAADQGFTGEVPIHGDVLELLLSYVPLVDLVPAAHVSRSWRRAVAASLRHFKRAKPWLLVHTQGRCSGCPSSTYAYDPRSGIWIEVVDAWRPPVNLASAVRSSHSTLLYALSPSRFSFSFDPLNLKWHHVQAPVVWRTDPSWPWSATTSSWLAAHATSRTTPSPLRPTT